MKFFTYNIYIIKTKFCFDFSILSFYLILLALLIYPLSHTEASHKKVIAITQIAPHPSLDKIRQGIIDELKEQGYEENKNLQIYYENAQGNITTATQIAQKFVGLTPDIIIAITTSSAQTIMKADQARKIPILFSGITDPLAAGLVSRLEKPGGFVTGVIDFPPIKQQLLLIKKLMPGIKCIGVVYNPGEINAVNQIKVFEKYAKVLDIKVLKSPASKTNDVLSATKYLIHEAEAIYVANDNTIVLALEAVLKVTSEYKIPLFASDGESVSRGALLALANNQYEVGRDTGKQAIKILKGKKPANINVISSNKTKLYLNKNVAKSYQIRIPPKLFQQLKRK